MADTVLKVDVMGHAQPAVRKAVLALREASLRAAPGAFLGQEEELIARYQVSRPTLRQAAALVGQEQLISVRRGVGGGYFASRPDASGVAHMAAILLQVQGARLDDMLRAIEVIRAELVALAARSASPEDMRRLAAFLEEDGAVDAGDYDYRQFLEAERRHCEIVGQAGGSIVLHLFMQILLDLVATLRTADNILLDKGERYLEWRIQRNKMLRAIIARDPDIAQLEAQRGAAMVRQWLEEDCGAAA